MLKLVASKAASGL